MNNGKDIINLLDDYYDLKDSIRKEINKRNKDYSKIQKLSGNIQLVRSKLKELNYTVVN